MEDRDDLTVGWAGPVSAEAMPVLKPDVVEDLLAWLGRGEKVKRLAAECGVDRKTIWGVASPGLLLAADAAAAQVDAQTARRRSTSIARSSTASW